MTRKHRILFIMPTGSMQGGVSTWLVRAVQSLGAQGWGPMVGLTQGSRYNRAAEYRRAHPELPSVVIDGRGMDREGRTREVLRCIQRVKPAMVIPLGVHDAFWAACQWKQRDLRGRLILRNQGLLPGLLGDLCRFGPVSDLVVCNSRLVAEFAAAEAGVPRDRVWNISNGADPATQREAGEDLADASGCDKDRGERENRKPGFDVAACPLRLGYVGRLMQGDKRVLDLVALCEHLRQRAVPFTLDIVGDGPAAGKLREELARDEYRGMIRFHGSLPLAAVHAAIYPNLDALLLLSASESFGIVLVEAMMHGVVPVTSQYLGFFTERLVVDGENGLSFPVGDMSAAAACVARLAQDRILLAKLAEQGRKRAEQQYTWKHCFDRWDQALQWVLAQPPRSAEHGPLQQRTLSGTLDRWGIPPGLTHSLRRLRRALIGPPVAPGGEEWPLFGSNYGREQLDHWTSVCESLDRQQGSSEPPNGPFAELQRSTSLV